MKRTAAIALFLVLPAVSGRADSYTRQPSIDVLHYEISIDLDDRSDSITATAIIYIVLQNDRTSGMWLDLTGMHVDRLRINGAETPFTYRNGRLSFNFDRMYAGDETIAIEVDYSGTPGKAGTGEAGMRIRVNKYGRRVFFADNWPDFASHWFPSIDHPSDKATVDFIVTAPDSYTVVANGHMVQIVSVQNGRKRTRWSEKHPIPTYSMTVGAAEFSVHIEATDLGVPVSWYVYPQDTDAAARMFRGADRVLRFFSERIAPYPYEKLTQVEATTQMAAMENANTIFYSESLFYPMPVPENPVPHEIAHQWFGNSVTPADWDHLWLSEGFATYFDTLFRAQALPSVSLKESMAVHADKIFTYSPARFKPVIDPDQTDLMGKLNPLTYEKGAWVLHMLRGVLGDEAFFEGIANYYRLYKDRNVWTKDFQKVMEMAGGVDLGTFFRQWLYQPAWPEYQLSWNWDQTDCVVEIRIRQIQTSGLFDMPVNMVVSSGGKKENHRIRIKDRDHKFRIPLLSPPSSIELDPDGWVLKTFSVQNN
jgi:aminopeptidase N